MEIETGQNTFQLNAYMFLVESKSKNCLKWLLRQLWIWLQLTMIEPF